MKIEVKYCGLMPTLTEKKLILINAPLPKSKDNKMTTLIFNPAIHQLNNSDTKKLKDDLIFESNLESFTTIVNL